MARLARRKIGVNHGKLIEEVEGYSVVLPDSSDGGMHFARGSKSAPDVYRRRREALKFRDKLVEHGCSKGRVIRVICTVKET